MPALVAGISLRKALRPLSGWPEPVYARCASFDGLESADPASARFASYGGFESAEARSAKAEARSAKAGKSGHDENGFTE